MEHSFVFPAIRGVQAGREYYVSMCPLRIIPKIFIFDEEELSAELRAQRTLNQNRIPEMARYVLKNPDDYVFSALTASIDGEVEFEPAGDEVDALQKLGSLRVPMTARFIINDGQHRRAAIEMALRENPTLGSETISVVFFVDAGLERSQQMFADLNRYAVRPSKSLGVLYDHRDEMAHITRLVVFSSEFFRNLVEMERSSLSLRSRKLFTLSSLHNANTVLLNDIEAESVEEHAEIAVDYWEAVAKHIPHWQQVKTNDMKAGEVRQDFIHSHSLSLEALARVGVELITGGHSKWKKRLKNLEKVDWARSNPQWEGRALSGGRVTNSRQNVLLTTSLLKQHLDLPLSSKEQEAEKAYHANGRLKDE